MLNLDIWRCSSRDVQQGCEIKPQKEIVHRVGDLGVSGLRWLKTLKSEKNKGALNKEPGGRDFSGGPVVKNPPSNAGDTGSIPGWELRSHMPWGN